MIVEDDSTRVSINDIQEEVCRVVVGLTAESWETKLHFIQHTHLCHSALLKNSSLYRCLRNSLRLSLLDRGKPEQYRNE